MKTNGAKREPRDTSAVGLNPVKRDAMGAAMRVLTRITGSDLAEKYNLRQVIDRVTYEGTKTGFKTLGAATRTFNRVSGNGAPKRLPDGAPKNAGYFDLTPDDEQKMIVETVREFSAEILRPAAYDADEAAAAPADLLKRSAELGITLINIPEEFEGVASERGAVTNSLVAEALAHGDMGLALPILAPSGVAVALTQWGTDSQQKTYLPAFAGENVPAAAVVVSEPRALFDPFALQTKAVRSPSGYKLNGVKSLVPAAGSAELFVVAAELDGRPAFFIVESDTKGLVVEADPSMGLRAAGLGRLVLTDVAVPESAILGDGRRRPACPRVRRRGPSRPPGLGVARGRHQPGRARLRDPLRQRAGGIRRADQPPSGGGVHDREHRDRTRQHASGDAAGRISRGAGPVVRA